MFAARPHSPFPTVGGEGRLLHGTSGARAPEAVTLGSPGLGSQYAHGYTLQLYPWLLGTLAPALLLESPHPPILVYTIGLAPRALSTIQ